MTLYEFVLRFNQFFVKCSFAQDWLMLNRQCQQNHVWKKMLYNAWYSLDQYRHKLYV